MSHAKLPLILILLLAVALIGEFAYRYHQLPAMMASHFNAQGVPDGWMPKEQFAAVYVGLFLFMGLGTAGLIAGIWFIPVAMINLPRKQYWLAPEREQTTRRMLVQRSLWFLVATWGFIVWLMHGTLQVNLGQAQNIEMVPALVFYLGFTAVWVVELCWRFSRGA